MYHYCHRILYIFHVWTHEKKKLRMYFFFFCGTHVQLGSLNELIIYILYFSPLKYLPRCDVAFNYNLCKTIILLVMLFWNEGICSTSIWPDEFHRQLLLTNWWYYMKISSCHRGKWLPCCTVCTQKKHM